MATAALGAAGKPEQAKTLYKSEGQWTIVFRRFRKHHLAMVSVFLIFMLFLASLLAPIIAPFGRDDVDVGNRFAPIMSRDAASGKIHYMGTDHIGRDLFTRILYAGRVTLSVAFTVATLATLIGMAIGTLAGFYRGIMDTALMRFLDFWATLPEFPILLIVAAILITDPNLLPIPPFLTQVASTLLLLPDREARVVIVVVFILTVLGWIGAARLMRGMVLSVRERDFIEATRSLGASSLRLMLRHVVPNAFPPLIVTYTLALAGALLSETALSFLGLGVQDPTPTWGNMLAFATSFMLVNPWLPLIPGVPVVICSLAFNFIGDGLRDALDPRLKM
jgi:peptide/nickel transport system permease protein